MSDDPDKKKKQAPVDLNRRDFLRGGFFRRAIEHQQAQQQAQQQEQEARAAAPVRPEIPDHRAYIGPADDGLTEEQQLALAQARARAMLGVVRPPQDQQPFDLQDLLHILESEQTEDSADETDDQPRIAHIDPDLCLAHQRSFCSVCVERCPEQGALVLQDHLPQVQPDLCTGCAICQRACPAPINAIRLL